MKVRDIMTKDPEIAQVTDSIMDVAAMMRDMNIGFMPILDGDILTGVVTDRDITIRAVAEGLDIENTSIGDIMTTDVQTISQDADVDEAAALMEEYQIRRLPVVDEEGIIVGVLSLGDIAVRTKDFEKSGEILEQVSEPSRPELAA